MKFLNTKLFLSAIFVTAVFLRFFQISTTAPALNWDEAALGYNAYSLGIDGRDEFGKFLPLQYLESYGDFKPPIYSYLSVVPVKLLGLSEFGVRFASAFFGSLTVLLTFFLVKEIFPKNKNKESIGLFSSLLLAISPWHIMLSRGAYEANVSTFFIVLGIFLFIKSINKNLWLLCLSAISFGLSFYTFNTARIFVPLLVLFLAIGFRRKLWENKKQVIVAALVGLTVMLPLIPFLVSPQAKLRYNEVNIFSNIDIVKKSNQEIQNDNNASWSKIIHNRRVGYGLEFAKHYLDNFNPSFLFIKGDGNPRFSTQDVGQMYIVELPLLLIGIFVLLRKKEGYYWMIPIWILLAIIPAATARETPHALRIETTLPAFQIISAYGFIYLLERFAKRKATITGIVLLVLFLSTYYFFHGLTTHYAREFSSEWQYPYKEVVSYVSQNKDKYKSVQITDELGRPYMYFLLYDKYDPRMFRESLEKETEAYGFVHLNSFDKYTFKGIDRGELKKGTLYIDIPSNLSDQAKVLKTFYLLDGLPGLVAYEIN